MKLDTAEITVLTGAVALIILVLWYFFGSRK
jgi:hypothetical protein